MKRVKVGEEEEGVGGWVRRKRREDVDEGEERAAAPTDVDWEAFSSNQRAWRMAARALCNTLMSTGAAGGEVAVSTGAMLTS